MINLPCLLHGSWIHHKGEPLSEFSMIKLWWDIRDVRLYYPYFYRKLDGSILFPSAGQGWYWWPEYASNSDGHLVESWSYVTSCKCKPFSFIPDVYSYRLKLKEEGSYVQLAIKLAMNSFYGKVVQKVGYNEYTKKKPTYHALTWGGYITSLTRAALFDAANQKPFDTIMFATDAIYTTKKLDLPCSTKLGDWDYYMYDGITIVQPGVYWVKDKNKWLEKYRGFDPESLHRDKVVSLWQEKQTEYVASLTRFITLGSALISDRYWNDWRKWITSDRVLDLIPKGKRWEFQSNDYSKELCASEPMWNPDAAFDMSRKYEIPWAPEEINYEREL
ncbi:MAG: hypothetical protein ACRDFB_05755, partial [Rhabdochlamydiaceae bacterium]